MSAEVPRHVRVQLAHAAVQHVADAEGLAALHVKGPALDPLLRYPGRSSTDADVLLRPAEAERLVGVLCDRGWRLQTSFRANSSFEHAAALTHEAWGAVDVHRWFPGVTLVPDRAFELLWRGRDARLIAGRSCPVPALPAQALLVLLHAARPSNSARAKLDVDAVWTRQPPALRREVVDLVRDLRAEVAFAAATGGLDAYRHHPHHLQWRVASQGGTRVEEWRGRMRAAPTRRDALRVAVTAPLVNTEHLTVVLGQPPTGLDVGRELVARWGRVVREELRHVRRRRRG